jgi:hypothetical protein
MMICFYHLVNSSCFIQNPSKNGLFYVICQEFLLFLRKNGGKAEGRVEGGGNIKTRPLGGRIVAEEATKPPPLVAL